MEPTGETKASARGENKPKISQLEKKGRENVTKLPEQIQKWLRSAIKRLQNGEPRNALTVLSQPPSDSSLRNNQDETQHIGDLESQVDRPNQTTEDEPSGKFSEERRALGLKKEKTLQEIAQGQERKRKEAIDFYLTYREPDKKKETSPTFEEILQKGQEKRKSILDALSTREKTEIAIRRTKALAIMTAKGIRDPERVLQILEAELGEDPMFSYKVENIAKNDDFGKYKRKEAIDAFYSIYEHAQSAEFINGCQQIGNVYLACERMHQIGGKFSLKYIGFLDTEQLIPMAQKLARIPREQFTTMLNDLHQYSFLFPERSYSYSAEDNLAFNPLVEFMSSNPNITAEQRQVLETAKRIYQICAPGKYGYQDFHPILSKHDPSLLLSSRERLSDELIVLEQLILELYDPREGPDSNLGKHWKQKDLYEKNKYVSGQIEKLAKAGDLHTLAELVRNGFTIGADNVWLFTDEYRRDEGKLTAFQEDMHKGAKLLEQFSDRSLLSEILFIEDLRKSENSEYEVLAIDRAKLFESLIRERQISEDTLKAAINLVNKLTDDPAKRVHLLNRFIVFDNNLGISLNIPNLLLEIKSPNILDKLPSEDQAFWKQIFEWRDHKFQWLGESHDFVSLFFVQNQTRFGEFFQDGKLTDSFFNEFTIFFNKVSEKYFSDHNINKSYIIQSINSFLLDRDQAPPCIRELAGALTPNDNYIDNYDVQSIYEVLGTNYSKWNTLVTDGKPNVNLVSLVLENSQKLNIAYKLLTADVIRQLPEEQRDFWIAWRDITPYSLEMSLFLYKNRERFAEFYQEQHLTPTFLEEFYKDAFSKGSEGALDIYGLGALIRNGLLDNFSRTDFTIWSAINKSSYQSKKFAVEHLSEIKNYFDEKGNPNPQFLVNLAKEGVVDLQQALLSEEALSSFSQSEQTFWREWKNLPDEGKIVFNQKLANNPQITEQLIEEIKLFNNLFEEIKSSSSLELQKIRDQLILELLRSSQPQEKLQRIIALFEKNNLPDFAKKFRIFEILYLTPDLDGKTRFDQEMEEKGQRLSPTLRKASRRRRLDIIYRDLLRINIDSADLSLRNYLYAIKAGQALFDKIDTQGIDSLYRSEIKQLTTILNRLNVLYENSLLGRQHIESATPLPESLSLEARIGSLREDLQVRPGQTITDRLAEMFLRPVGYDSIDAVLARMDEVKRQAHIRNLSNPRVQEGKLEINAGDLLKGIHDDILGYILQNGSIAREYIGVNADSDATPFDTDLGMVLQEDLDGGLPHVISSSPARAYGNVIIVVRNRGQFIRTGQQENLNLQYNPKNYELFSSGYVDVRHYGIRTGFPSTEIDAIILTQELLDESEASALKREQIFFNIANNGFYIPVVNPEGKIIFTEEDYNRYRLEQQAIKDDLVKEEFDPKGFIDLLKSSPYLKTLYEMSSGVSEGYSTEKHTLMVMGQFEKYFSEHINSPFLTREDFRLMLALHDIGKPLSVYYTGSTWEQHEYTKKVLTYALQATGIQPQKVDMIINLVDQDILGEYFKGIINVKDAVNQINKLADTIQVLPKDLIDVLKMFYICDAGSYTEDVGGQRSLDYLFVFDRSDGKNTVSFSDQYEAKFQELIRQIDQST